MRGKVVLITGAAKGLGKALAQNFGLAGASVFITDFDLKAGTATALELLNAGIRAKFCFLDLNSQSDIENAVLNCVNEFGGLNVLINNARPPLKIQPFPEAMSEWDLAIQVLLKAPALLIAAALPKLIASKNGNVINISSTNAFSISHQPLSYHVAKAGIVQMTRHLASELGSKGVRVNAICPGIIELMEKKGISGSQLIGNLITKTVVPLGRAANLNEVTDLAIFLASDAASYINGQAITIDGGMTNGCQYSSAFNVLNKIK